MALTVAFVGEGSAETSDCWSGCAQGFVQGLRSHGVRVDVFDVELRSWRRWLAAGVAFHPRRRRWRNRYRFGAETFRLQSVLASAVSRGGRRYDAIIQAGATFHIPAWARRGAASIVYADANLHFARRGYPFSGVSELDDESAGAVARRERATYDAADRIWAWSEVLARSFVEDFGQESDKVLTIYAGANAELSPDPMACRNRPPLILFVGKDFRRKGAEVLLTAFRMVRERIPESQLHFLGSVPPGANQPGVFSHGFIRADTPEGTETIQRLYRNATVFCLPSRYEPFGVSFVEAMLAGLPCIGVNRWAMPEIIADGITGWVVADGDVGALADRLCEVLREPERSAAMGRAGRRRALELFTWNRVASRAVSDLEQLCGKTPQPSFP